MRSEPVEAVTHVLYLSEEPGRSPLSGAELHVLMLLRGLASDGAAVHLIAMLWSGTGYARITKALRDLEHAGISVTRVQRRETMGAFTRWIAMIAAWGQLARLLRSRRHHVIHLHMDLVVAPMIAWLVRCRSLVISIHNDEPAYVTRVWRMWWRVLRLLPVRLIAITQHVNDYVCQAAKWPSDRIDTVYYGVEEPSGPPLSRRDLDVPADAFVVGFVGRLAVQKNVGVLLQALAERSDVVGVFVGDGPLRDELSVVAPENVTFLGAIPHAARAMPSFDILCLPSLWEGLGLVLVEAMLQCVPIVASDRGAIPEVLGHGRFGVICHPTAASIGAGIDAARNNPMLTAQRAEQARCWALERFSMPAMVEASRQVYAATGSKS